VNALRRTGLAVWQSPTLMTWASLAIRVGGLALLLPLVLTHLETSEVLVWQMLAAIVALVGWVDFGFSPTFARIIAFARGGGTLASLEEAMPAEARVSVPDDRAGEAIEMGAVLGTQQAIYRRLLAVAAVAGGVLGTAALMRPVSGLADPIEGWAAWAITALAALLTLLNTSNVAVITGFDRIAQTRRIESLVGTGQLASTSLVVVLGSGLAAIVACYSAWTFLQFLLNRALARRVRAVEGGSAGSHFDPELFRLIWPAAWRSGVGILMSAGIIQGSGLVYAQFATPAAAASYLLALRLMSALSPIAQAPFYTRLPLLARLRAEGKRGEMVRTAARGVALSHWTYVAGALALVALGPRLLDTIGSSVRLPGEALMTLLMLAFFVERYSAMHIQIYSLTNHIVWHIANGVTGALMIAVGLLLLPLIGATAMPAAMLAAYLGFCSWYAARLSARSLGIPLAQFDRKTMYSPAASLAAGLALIAFAGA
jgi:hypothetical protein